MLNVDQIAPGFQKDLVQKLGAFISHEMPSSKVYIYKKLVKSVKEDKTVGLEGVEGCSFLFPIGWKASGWLAELHDVLLKYVKWSGGNPCLLR